MKATEGIPMMRLLGDVAGSDFLVGIEWVVLGPLLLSMSLALLIRWAGRVRPPDS